MQKSDRESEKSDLPPEPRKSLEQATKGSVGEVTTWLVPGDQETWYKKTKIHSESSLVEPCVGPYSPLLPPHFLSSLERVLHAKCGPSTTISCSKEATFLPFSPPAWVSAAACSPELGHPSLGSQLTKNSSPPTPVKSGARFVVPPLSIQADF